MPLSIAPCKHNYNWRYFLMAKLVKCNNRFYLLMFWLDIGKDISCRWYVLVKSRIRWQGKSQNLQYEPKKYIQLDLFVATIIMILRIIYLLLLFREWFETFENNIFYSFPHNIKNSKENAAFIYKRNEFSTFLLDSKIETYFIYIDHAAILKVFG